mmetsp:Transcript_32535/g.31771  ORF Transcript_32535/g.31771 Transcript_32535/m.31771 type:complete len:214 (+) Transcript_32535:219-860(+)
MICYGVLIDPKECKNCQQSFCKRCITHWKNINSMCPLKCPRLELIEPHRNTSALLNKLKIKCKNNENGCTEILEYKGVLKHELICQFEKIQCPAFKDCNVEVFRGEIEKHKKECQFIKVQCSKCFKTVARRKMFLHERDDCPYSLVNCSAKNQGCLAREARKDLKHHENVCEYVRIKCEECHKLMQRRELAAHDCVAYLNILIKEQDQLNQRA